MEYKYFRNALFSTLHISLAVTTVYCSYKSISAS